MIAHGSGVNGRLWLLMLTSRLRLCIRCFFGPGVCRMFARLLRRNFLFAESHPGHQIRIRVRRFVPGFEAVLRCYLALGLLPGAGGFPGLRLSGRSGLAVRLGLRSRLGV